jgi:hypothetical protein
MPVARPLVLVALLTLLCTPSCRPREPAQVGTPGMPPTQPNAPQPGPPPAVRGPFCGRLLSQPVAPKTDPYLPSEAECNRAATIWANVTHEDLACQSDADCVALSGGAGGCFSAALNKLGASKPEYQARPCGNPAAGACVARPIQAYCGDGCCLVR